MNISLYEKICSNNNIKVVDGPLFTTCEIINGNIQFKQYMVGDYIVKSDNDILALTKNTNKLLYLYSIENNRLRCYKLDNNDIIKCIRKEKLDQLKVKEDV